MEILFFIYFNVVLADRLDNYNKDIDIGKLDKDYGNPDAEEMGELPSWHPDKPKEGMIIKNLDGRDHLTTWSESKKGKQFGLYINVIEGLNRSLTQS